MLQDLALQIEWGLNFCFGEEPKKRWIPRTPLQQGMSSYWRKGMKSSLFIPNPLSALTKDVTSFFSWGCRDMWYFPCREVHFSFGKGWKTIWVAYYSRHILRSCSGSEKEAAFSHFCNTPLFPCTKPCLIKHMRLDPWLMLAQESIKPDLHLEIYTSIMTFWVFFYNTHHKPHPFSSFLSFFNLMPSSRRHFLISPLYQLADTWSPNCI